jgi:hypothetical protein
MCKTNLKSLRTEMRFAFSSLMILPRYSKRKKGLRENKGERERERERERQTDRQKREREREREREKGR